MPKHVYQVSGLPQFTRSTDRIYTHAVIGWHSPTKAAARTERDRAAHLRGFRGHWLYYKSLAEATDSQLKTAYRNGKTVAEFREYVNAIIADYPTAESYSEAHYQNLLAKASQPATEPQVFTWCGRPDLAAKEVAKYSKDYDSVVAIPVELVATKSK
jgi:hypothetical protein